MCSRSRLLYTMNRKITHKVQAGNRAATHIAHLHTHVQTFYRGEHDDKCFVKCSKHRSSTNHEKWCKDTASVGKS